MNAATLDAIRAHALAAYPAEACGLVVVAKGRERYRPCRNRAETPSEHFVMAAEDYAAAEDEGEILAVVHSHPDVPARPSEGDRVACESSGLPWLIVSVMPDAAGQPAAGAIERLEPCGYRAPLVGRPFQHGVLDCWSLCRDWYLETWQLALPDPERRDRWWDDGVSNLYMQHLAGAGFAPVDGGIHQLRRGDLILMQVRSRNLVPNHAGIYLGDGLMLHHMHGRLSSRDVYGGIGWSAHGWWPGIAPRPNKIDQTEPNFMRTPVFLLGCGAALLLGGCIPKNIEPSNRAEWQQRHSRVIQGVTEAQVLEAAEKVLRLADHDFKFDYPENRLVAMRNWQIYAVLAVPMGTDYWQVYTKPVEGGVQVTVEISRQAGAITPTPVFGVGGAAGSGVTGVSGAQSMSPGQSIGGAFPYDLFWSRLNYMLGKDKHWVTCQEAKNGKDRAGKWDSDVLCSVTTDDKKPSPDAPGSSSPGM